MREEQATTYVDIKGHRHLVRAACAATNMGYRILDLIKADAGKSHRDLSEIGDPLTAYVIASWLASHPLEMSAILEQFITEKAGTAAVPSWMKEAGK